MDNDNQKRLYLTLIMPTFLATAGHLLGNYINLFFIGQF